MSGVSGTLPKNRMTDEEEEHVLNLGKRESPVLVPPSINKKIETLQVSLYIKLEIKPCGLGSRIRDVEAF